MRCKIVCVDSLLTAFCVVLFLMCSEVDRLDPRRRSYQAAIMPSVWNYSNSKLHACQQNKFVHHIKIKG